MPCLLLLPLLRPNSIKLWQDWKVWSERGRMSSPEKRGQSRQWRDLWGIWGKRTLLMKSLARSFHSTQVREMSTLRIMHMLLLLSLLDSLVIIWRGQILITSHYISDLKMDFVPKQGHEYTQDFKEFASSWSKSIQISQRDLTFSPPTSTNITKVSRLNVVWLNFWKLFYCLSFE